MKYMLIMRSTVAAVEGWKGVDFEVINAMGRYNESMIKAGVLLSVDGLTEAKEGFVVDFSAEWASRHDHATPGVPFIVRHPSTCLRPVAVCWVDRRSG